MIVKAARRIVVPPGLVIETYERAVCPDSAAYDLAAHGAVLVGVRARVLNDGTMVGNAVCDAGDVVDLPIFADMADLASPLQQKDIATKLASFQPAIQVVFPGASEPVDVPVMNAAGLVGRGQARYADPARVAEL
jgi:hypothetical protein